jgi:hypothetical protein
MTIEPDKIADLRMKHLEILQGVVTRIAGQGATLKNYCITLTTAVCGFAISLQKPVVALLALLPIMMFCLLDTQYLRIERRLRGLFNKVRGEDWAVVPSFEISLEAAPKMAFATVLWSWSIISFYLPLAVGVLLVAVIAGWAHGKFI